MKESRIYVSLAELKFMAEKVEAEGLDYVAIDWVNRQIWHDLSVHEMPRGKSFDVPFLDEGKV